MVSQPCILAMSNPGAFGLLLMTAATLTGSFASISACILLPRPEMRITRDFIVSNWLESPWLGYFYVPGQLLDDGLSFICIAVSNCAYTPYSFAGGPQRLHCGIRQFRRHYHRHADAAIKHAMHFTIRHVALLLQPTKKRRHVPCLFFENRRDTVWQNTRYVFR